jgi:hypothetical protein
VNPDLARAIWEWLPARTDSRRVTLPGTIAAALSATHEDVQATLSAMAAAGHVVRDSATGTSSGWHRGTPIPTLALPAEPVLALFDTENGA